MNEFLRCQWTRRAAAWSSLRQVAAATTFATLLATSLISTPAARAQSLTAGQTTGVTYVDFVPDKLIGNKDSLSIDLDQDGRQDFKLSYSQISDYYGHTYLASLKALHSDAATVASIIRLPPPLNYAKRNAVFSFAAGELIAQALPTRVSLPPYSGLAPSNYWVDNFYADNSYFLYDSQYRGQGDTYGLWPDVPKQYAGVRLRATSGGAWRYGWLQVELDIQNGIIVKDYALTTTVLAQQAAAAAGWQLYPTPVADRLTVVPPPAATPGRLMVRDLCGRALLQTALTGSRQEVNLAALAAGLYMLELETAAGSSSQRIVKQ